MATQDPTVHPDALDLAQLLRPFWADISAGIPDWHPRCEGDDADKDADADKDKDDADKDADADADKVTPDDDWKAKARKHEAVAKKERKAREDLEKRLKEIEDRDKSDQDKAIEKAREEARTEVLTEAQKERRQDRLEVASTRLAAKGITIGDGDDTETVKFADPDDALVYIERAIRAGDIDESDIFDEDNKVQPDALKQALADILDSKPHLRASEGTAKPKGSADTRRGKAADTDLEAMTPEDHAKRKYGAAK